MIIKLLKSSSKGNATVIESAESVIMIDAGLSYKAATAIYGGDLLPKAVFITHEHGDHVSGAGIIGRKAKCPVYIPEASYNAKQTLFKECIMRFVTGGQEIIVDDLKIKVFSTKHDSAASVGYIVTEISTGKKLGFLTDTGVITKMIRVELENCDAYFIETDYDEQELEKYAEYDDLLKERIKSPIGHLSNTATLNYVKEHLNLDAVQWITFGHLSEKTNSPELLQSQIENKFDKAVLDKFHIANKPLTLEII